MYKLLLIIIPVIFLTFEATAQEDRDTSRKESGMMKRESPEVVAKPAFEGNSGNFNLTVWIMSAINEKRDNDAAVKDESEAGSHHIMIDLKDAEKSRDISGAIVKVLSVSPSGKKETTELESMMNQYGGNINLDEKGEYQLNISVEAEGNSTSCPVVYTVN